MSWKTQLFNDQYQKKLDNPDIPLANWVDNFYAQPVKVNVEKFAVKRRFLQLGASKMHYKISVQDPVWPDCPEAVRSESDVVLLFKQLELRFPESVGPGPPPDMSNVSLVRHYIQKVADNPFWRNDVSYSDFVDGRVKEYAHTKKNDRKMSEGTLRWLQCITAFPEVSADGAYMGAVVRDLTTIDKEYRALMKALKTEISALQHLEASSKISSDAFEAALSAERSAERGEPVNLSGAPKGQLASTMEDIIAMQKGHQEALGQSLSGLSFKRVLYDGFYYELGLINGMRKQVSKIQKAKKAYDNAQLKLDQVKNSDQVPEAKKKALETKKETRYLPFYRLKQGGVGYELESLKRARTVFFQRFQAEQARFYLRGSEALRAQWGKTGILLDHNDNKQFAEDNLRYSYAQPKRKATSAKPTSPRALSRPKMPPGLDLMKTLGRKSLRSVAVTEVGLGLNDDADADKILEDWSDDSDDDEGEEAKQPVSAPKPAALNKKLKPKMSRLKFPSFDQGKVTNRSSAAISPEALKEMTRQMSEAAAVPPKKELLTPPQPPSPPGFLQNKTPAVSSLKKPDSPKIPEKKKSVVKAESFKLPPPPVSSAFPGTGGTSNFGGNDAAPAFGEPGAPPVIPDFGSPNADELPPPPSVDSRKKSFAPLNKSKTALALGTSKSVMPSKPEGTAKKKKATKNRKQTLLKSMAKANFGFTRKTSFNKSSAPKKDLASVIAASGGGSDAVPGGVPPRPPMAMNFLADIEKGKKAKKLKKVPESQKKDASEPMVKKNGASSGGSAKAAPPAAGGGFAAELQARLNRRK